MGASANLLRGREAFQRRSWRDAYELLAVADREAPLVAEDLDRLATAAYLVGRDDEYLSALERAYHAHLDAGAALAAARAAFWLGLRLLFRGEVGRATGWLGRARRHVEHEGHACVEQGYLLLPAVQARLDERDPEGAFTLASEAATFGERFREPDLTALARHLQGLARIAQARVREGLALLDEAMTEVTVSEASPLATGLVYCGVIEGCTLAHEFGRAREWTATFARWCDEQPDMLAFSGVCRVHRAEIFLLGGAWSEALEEARCAYERSERVNRRAAGEALYQRAELHRLQGELDRAESAYRAASQLGREPQPGLSLLRCAQEREAAGAAALRALASATTDGLQRARLLPAYVEVLLAAGDLEGARAASRELSELAAAYATAHLDAVAELARGAVELAGGGARAALGALRSARQTFQDLGAPYAAARARVLVALASREVGDHDSSSLELEAARSVFAALGAAPDVARVDAIARGFRRGSAGERRPLTPRELQVLCLIATGKTNKEIGANLSLSERTIDRHVSKIFMKLGVRSRAAATAYAYRHGLLETP